MTEHLQFSPAQEQAHWAYKAVVATRGNTTLLGAILLQLIGKQAKAPPQVLSTATVDKNGLTWARLSAFKHGEYAEAVVPLGLITDIRDEFRRLADWLKLDDVERLELFDELRKWVAVDLRAEPSVL